MRLRFRLTFLLLFLAALLLIGRAVTGSFRFLANDFWFTSGWLLLLLVSLIDQPFFSTDANVFMNATAGLSLVLVESSQRDFWWHLFTAWCLWLLLSSYALMAMSAYRPLQWTRPRVFLSRINRELGRPEAIFSAFFIWGAIRQFGLGSAEVQPLFAFWVLFMIVNVPAIARSIDSFMALALSKSDGDVSIATLHRISDPRIVELRLNESAPQHLVGKYVELATRAGSEIGRAVVIDDRIVAGTRLAKIAATSVTSKWSSLAAQPEGTTVTVSSCQSSQTDGSPVGVVDAGSSIGSLRFLVHPDLVLKKGEIVSTTSSDGCKVFFQATLAHIVENSTVDGNATKSTLVTATQLGIWNEKSLCFELFPWVAPAGQLVYRCAQAAPADYHIPETNALVGTVPNSAFPVHVSLDDLVTHNAAIIGVTGSGKSYLAFHLIESLLARKVKVLILDISREHYAHLHGFRPEALTDHTKVTAWLAGDSLLGIHQFANSQSYPFTTKQFCESALAVLAQTSLRPGHTIPARLCIVFEEAHSLIPEWNQTASKDDAAYVNATARTILQGRKYGMGSLVVTQRTANVTKTILNQCNTIMALRSYDQTVSTS